MEQNISLQVRLANKNDIELAIKLDYEVFSPTQTQDSTETITARYKVYPKGFVVAFLDDCLVGYISSEKWNTMRTPKMFEDPNTTHSETGSILCITAMAVAKDHRGHRIGEKMLNFLLGSAILDGCIKVVVETPRTKEYYEKQGFKVINIVKDGSCDAYVLEKGLRS